MNAASMNPQHSRRLAILVLLAAVLLVAGPLAGAVWYVNHYYDVKLAEKQDRIERFQRIASTRAAVSRQLDSMRAKETRKFFLRTGATALSAAEAQEAVRSIIESSGGKLITMQAPSSREEGRYRQISVTVQLTATVQSLRRVLHALESNMPYLFVDNVTIRSQVTGQHRAAPGQEPEMFVSFDVNGYTPLGGP
jgi:general secretion pathway protein M